MSNRLAQIVVLFFSVLLVYGGVGVNLVTYCCQDCEVAGIEVVAHSGCCDIHEHEHEDCSHESEASCNIERINFEWKTIATPSFSFVPMMCAVPSFMNSSFTLRENLFVSSLNIDADTDPPVFLPDVYLDLLTTLLI